MKKIWYVLSKKQSASTPPVEPPAPVIPEAWVTETHQYNAAQDRIEVYWKLNISEAQTSPLFVSIYHSVTSNGQIQDYTWEIPAGQTFAQGLYLYPANNIAGVEDLKYGIYLGTGYTLPDSQDRPKEAQINVEATLPPVTNEEPPAPGTGTPAEYVNPWPEAASYMTPKVITQGGTYYGNWRSTDPNVPAVTIATAEPVILMNTNTEANGVGIGASVSNVNLTVLNPRHFGGAISYRCRRFIALENFKNLVVKNFYFQNSSGIYIAGQYRGNGTPDETVKILYGRALNIDGRTTTGSEPAQFFQSNTFRPGTFTTVYDAETQTDIKYYDGVPHMEIGWCDIHNQPGLSHVEDNINIYNTRGTPASPIRIHNVFVNGAYYYNWQSENFSGSGMIADSPGANKGACTAYVKFEWCSVLMSNAAPFGVAGGNNIEFINCVGLSKSYLSAVDCTRLSVSGAASELRGYPGSLYVTDNRYNMNSTHSITITNYKDGVHGERTFSASNPRWRNDYSNPAAFSFNPAYGTMTGTIILPGLITEVEEQAERDAFLSRVNAAGVHIGVVESNTGYYNNFETAASINDPAFSKETSTAYGITRSNLFAASGSHAARFELRNTDGPTFNGVRAEIAFAPMQHSDMVFKFAWRLNSADNALDTNPESIMQFRPVADANEDDGRGTQMSLQVQNGQLRFYTAYATAAQNTEAEAFTWYELGAVNYNQWNITELRYKPAIDQTGIIELKINNTVVVNHLGPNRYNDVSLPFFKLGLYKWNWPATNVSTMRVLYVDNIICSKTPTVAN